MVKKICVFFLFVLYFPFKSICAYNVSIPFRNENRCMCVMRTYIKLVIRVLRVVWHSLYLLHAQHIQSLFESFAQPFKCIITYSLLCRSASCSSMHFHFSTISTNKMNCKLPRDLTQNFFRLFPPLSTFPFLIFLTKV